jgi:hypothetical protein
MQMLQQQLERLRKVQNSDDRVKDLEASYEALRDLIKCSICHVNNKNAMLKHCNHVFCKKCLLDQTKSRSRICPGCQVKFGFDV